MLDAVLPDAQESGVTLLVETIGIFSDTDRLCEVLNSYACDNLAALWDLQHTFPPTLAKRRKRRSRTSAHTSSTYI